MTQIICETVSKGMRPQKRTVCIRDAVTGRRSFLRVEADFLTTRGERQYLPVGVVQEEHEQGLILVELPQEPDAGDARLWIRQSDLLPAEKVAV